MLKKSLATAIIGLAMATAACSGGSEASRNEAISAAEEAMTRGDNEAAKASADDILDSGDAQLTATQLGRLSIIYMQLSDIDEMEDNTAVAFQCYRNAFKANADSAAAFYASITGDGQRYTQMLEALKSMIENPDKNNIDEMPDDADGSTLSTDTIITH